MMTGLWLTDPDRTPLHKSVAPPFGAEVSPLRGARALRLLRLSCAIRRGADVLSDATDGRELFKR